MTRRVVSLTVALLGFLGLLVGQAWADGSKDVGCTMDFSLSGWSVFYKRADGAGTITCSNGQTSRVKLTVRGGGLTFGKSRIEGKGTFSGVTDIGQIWGDYGSGGAHAGAGKSAAAQVMTKGAVSLALSGTGRGVDLGVDFGKLVITRVP